MSLIFQNQAKISHGVEGGSDMDVYRRLRSMVFACMWIRILYVETHMCKY